MLYSDCKIIGKLTKSKIPIATTVNVDEFTEMVSKNFDYEFNGMSEIYPYEVPELPDDFSILCIVGASGSGKSTLIKGFSSQYNQNNNTYNNNAIVSNFNTPEEACDKLSAVGLNSLPVWCRPRHVLSVGEGFRADVALNLNSYQIFDEFTSTIDRNVAKSTCNGLQRYIRKHNLHNLVFVSCHKDFISFLQPDIVIDLDDENIYDCRGECLGETLSCTSMKQIPKMCGTYLGSITI